MDTDCFPFSTWARLLRGELTDKASKLLEVTPPQGVPELREEICRYLAEFRGIAVQPEQVVVGAGSEYLLNPDYPSSWGASAFILLKIRDIPNSTGFSAQEARRLRQLRWTIKACGLTCCAQAHRVSYI